MGKLVDMKGAALTKEPAPRVLNISINVAHPDIKDTFVVQIEIDLAPIDSADVKNSSAEKAVFLASKLVPAFGALWKQIEDEKNGS